MNPTDAHHADAIEWMRQATQPQIERWISAVNYSELLVAPLREGKQDHVKAMLMNFSVATAAVDMAVAERAAGVRAQTNLRLPDSYALATAMHLEDRGRGDVRLATFDKQILKAHAELRSR